MHVYLIMNFFVIFIYIYIYIHTHIYTHTHTYIYIYIYIYICSLGYAEQLDLVVFEVTLDYLGSLLPLEFLQDIVCFFLFFSVKQFSFIRSIDVRRTYSRQIINIYDANVFPCKTPGITLRKSVYPLGGRTFAFVCL